MRVTSAIACLAMLAAPCIHSAEPDLASAIRPLIEQELRQNAGIGFVSFACDAEPPLGPGDRFDCSGTDEDGDLLRYTLVVGDEGGATVARAEQPAGSLAPTDLAALEAPCRAFLADYQTADWPALYGRLHPNLREALGDAAQTRTMLEPVRAFFGDVQSAEPTRFAVLAAGPNELEYRLQCTGGEASARFRIAADDTEELRLLAFVVTAPPGSPEQARLLEQTARERLSPVIGVGIAGFDVPFERLVRQGDAVEGSARLEDGRSIVIRAEQHGSRDDYDVNDYSFAVLDVPFLVDRALRQRLDGYDSVACSERVLPDGGATECVATLVDGGTTRLTVRREGGDHRIVSAGQP